MTSLVPQKYRNDGNLLPDLIGVSDLGIKRDCLTNSPHWCGPRLKKTAQGGSMHDESSSIERKQKNTPPKGVQYRQVPSMHRVPNLTCHEVGCTCESVQDRVFSCIHDRPYALNFCATTGRLILYHRGESGKSTWSGRRKKQPPPAPTLASS